VSRCSPEQRQAYAINRSREKAREKAMPLRTEVDRMITLVGWRKAHPVIEKVMGFPVPGRHGGWWGAVTVRRGQQLVDALHEAAMSNEERAGQTQLF
jgi:hypothetical protein